MFYLETIDGEKFFTDKDSNDRQEFEKILETKLGRDSAELFNHLVAESEENAEELLNSFKRRYHENMDALDQVLNNLPIDGVKMEEILSEFQAIYMDYLR